jgi:hypothetical protein
MRIRKTPHAKVLGLKPWQCAECLDVGVNSLHATRAAAEMHWKRMHGPTIAWMKENVSKEEMIDFLANPKTTK